MVKVVIVSYMQFKISVDADMRIGFNDLFMSRDQTPVDLMQSIVERGWIELLGERSEGKT